MAEPTANVDPNVRIPAAVTAAGVLADRLQKEQQEALARGEGGNQSPPSAPPASAPPASAPPASAAPPATNGDQSPPSAPPTTPPPQEQQLSEAEIAALPMPDKDSPEAKWRHAYLSMKGRHDHQVPRLQQQVNGLTQELQRTQNEIAQLRNGAAPPTTVAPNGAAPPSDVEDLTPEEIDQFGPELADTVRRLARIEAKRMVDPLRADLGSRVEKIDSRTDADLEQRMVLWLDQRMPNWDAGVNQNPEFITWLALRDPISGATRNDLLQDAWGKREASRVLAIFNSFVSENAAPAPAGTQPVQLTPAATPPAMSKRIPLETLAAPGGGQTAATDFSRPAEKQYLKASQIAQFYDDVNRGRYRGKEQKQREDEAEIFAAQAEGRVITNQ